ncbi:MAG TPA: malto-oligosyltrehalose synthase [Candidatus Saccharimonadales bacterium]|nr:malto-oligosyltrehalose synthase [Candidatus Saccharimonadales bacterium]
MRDFRASNGTGMRLQTLSSPDTTNEALEFLQRLAESQRRVRPGSAYRLQFNNSFRFVDGIRLIPYLQRLGITTLYASPILAARAGSMHGYDITDHNRINPEIGTEDELQQLLGELSHKGMSLLLDVVPNHMGVGYGTNLWWRDVLENGRASEYSNFFDIDWNPLKPELRNKVLLPVLGNQYGEELEAGRIVLAYAEGNFRIEYYDKVLPIDPQTIPLIFRSVGELRQPEDKARELLSLLAAFGELPPHTSPEPERTNRRQREMPYLIRRFADLVERSQEVREHVQAAVERLNGKPGEPHSYDALHALLEAQVYRLAHWRVSAEEINYRRFFDVNDLIGLRMEDPQVFAATQKQIRRLLAEEAVIGLRIDHPDGMFNPPQYFMRLQMLFAAAKLYGAAPVGELAENGIEVSVQNAFGQFELKPGQEPFYVVVEKILGKGEALPRDWPVSGTVGYEFANAVNGIFIDARNRKSFTNLYHRLIGESLNVDRLIYQAKKLVMLTALSSEVNVLSHMLDEISSTNRRARDFTRKVLRDAIRETIACFPVYRTYVDERGNISDCDRGFIAQAIAAAKRINGSMAPQAFDFLQDILLLREDNGGTPIHGYRRQLYFSLKFQQLTGPVMAKGVEDTVCYVYSRFISVNEVGGHPGSFGVSVDAFHGGNQERATLWPDTMLTTSTHDTKRSEDVRMRLNVLSEMPRPWAAQVMRWRRINRAKRKSIDGAQAVPDNNEEYFLYQTLVGTWPMPKKASMDPNEWALSREDRLSYIARIQEYMQKAVHEGKINLSWINPNQEYSDALRTFIARILSPGTESKPNNFLRLMHEFIPRLTWFGVMNSLAQTLLKLTSLGVPDIYQGQEVFDFSLVDPDNRRPVDFTTIEKFLNELEHRQAGPELCGELLDNWTDGRLKLWTTHRALRQRCEMRELFRHGNYMALKTEGARREHLVAFVRHYEQHAALVAVPRLNFTMLSGEPRLAKAEDWGNTRMHAPQELAGREMVNALTGECVTVQENGEILCSKIFAAFPVALLVC